MTFDQSVYSSVELTLHLTSFFVLRLSRKAPQSSTTDPLAAKPQPKKQQHSLEHHTPTVEEKIKPVIPAKPDRTARKSLRKEESRSRLPSISQLQEKLRKHWPRSLKMREGERTYPKIWKTAPRVVRKVHNETSFQINKMSFPDQWNLIPRSIKCHSQISGTHSQISEVSFPDQWNLIPRSVESHSQISEISFPDQWNLIPRSVKSHSQISGIHHFKSNV